jgi:hypothetical protein
MVDGFVFEFCLDIIMIVDEHHAGIAVVIVDPESIGIAGDIAFG